VARSPSQPCTTPASPAFWQVIEPRSDPGGVVSPPDAHALLVLAHLRNGDTYQRLADGFGIGVATAYRYIQEAITLLAALAPSLTAALWRFDLGVQPAVRVQVFAGVVEPGRADADDRESGGSGARAGEGSRYRPG